MAMEKPHRAFVGERGTSKKGKVRNKLRPERSGAQLQEGSGRKTSSQKKEKVRKWKKK